MSQSSSPSSNVIPLDGGGRQCHITAILPLTESSDDSSDVRTPIDFRVCLAASAYLALQHLKTPSQALTPNLASRLEACDIQFSMEFYDSKFSGIEAARALLTALDDPTRKPFALLGAARSSVSLTLATLATAFELPQISPSSTSDDLNDKARAAYFARTVPTNAGDAQAFMIYLKGLGIQHFGVYYVQDSFGTAFSSHLLNFASLYGLDATSFSYDSLEDIPTTMANLAATKVRYIIGVFNPDTWKEVFTNALQTGIMGPGYTWLLTEASLELTDSAFRLDRSTQGDLAQAIHGTGILTLDIPPSLALGQALEELFLDKDRREEFYQHHATPSIYDNWRAPTSGCGTSSIYPLLAYDAVLSLGVAACETPTYLFTGPEFYQQLLQTKIQGISGSVSFDNTTGTRAFQDLSFRMTNLLISPNRSTTNTVAFDTIPTAQVVLGEERVQEMAPFVYADNTTDIPSPYPPIQVEQNLVATGVQAVGLSLGALVMAGSVFLLLWVIRNRNMDAVRAGQPIFLCQILVGTVMIVSALIPLSLQEPVSQQGLDIACASVPWLISIGFVTAFSALFAKLWRLNQIFGVTSDTHSSAMYTRRIIRAKDVALPFVVLLALNVTILTTWTIINPMQRQRVPVNSYDSFGRVLETYGTCAVNQEEEHDGIRSEVLFPSLLLGVNFVALICALYQTYLARKIPSEFSEVIYIGMSFVMMFEVCMVGVPIILLVDENPTSLFMTQSILLSFIGMTMLIPIIAKYKQQKIYRATDPDGIRQRYWYFRAIVRAQRRLGEFFHQSSGVQHFSAPPGVVDYGSNNVAANGGSTNGTSSAATLQPSNSRRSVPQIRNSVVASFDRGSSWAFERRTSQRTPGHTRVRRTREFYEQQDAMNIRNEQWSNRIASLRQKLSMGFSSSQHLSASRDGEFESTSAGSGPRSSRHVESQDTANNAPERTVESAISDSFATNRSI